MHNLLLGTAKRMMNMWISFELISTSDFDLIQECVDSFLLPNDIGRIPYRIGSGFSGFKADQWRTWTIVYSLVSLKNILPAPHYHCWHLYVNACQLLCSRSLSMHALQKADALLTEFCFSFVALYGSEKTTPNMHMHLHLKDSIMDYGPVYAFWLFSYERYNGILGSVPTNNKTIEPQLMKRFVCDQQLRNEALPGASVAADILSHLSATQGSVKSQSYSAECRILGPEKECALTDSELNSLPLGHHCFRSYRKAKAIVYNGHIIGSVLSHSNASNVVAKHSTDGIQVAQIQYFSVLKTKPTEDRASEDVYVAYVRWYEPHPEKSYFSTAVYVCCKHHYDNSFIFLTDIISRAGVCYKTIQFITEETVLCAVPLEYNNI